VAAGDGAEKAEVMQGPDSDGLVGCGGREEGGMGVWRGLPGAGYGRGGEGCEVSECLGGKRVGRHCWVRRGGCGLGKGSEYQVRAAGRGDRALDIQDPIGRVCQMPTRNWTCAAKSFK
jgi:hypothetical protein